MDELTISLVNQIFEIERKLTANGVDTVDRNIDRIKYDLAESGVKYLDPVGERYQDTRTDCSATVVGELSNKMIITKTLKPIIVVDNGGGIELAQKATVIVEAE